MDLRGQDHKRIVIPSSFVYNTSIRELTTKPSHASLFSTLGGRIDGAAIPSSSHVFHINDHHIYLQQPPPPLELQQQVTPAPPPPPRPQQQQQQQKQEVAPPPPPKSPIQPNQGKAPDPDPEPEPEPVSVAVAGVTSTPTVGGGSKHPTQTRRNEATFILYGECLKNHAANVGGHVLDGCGEFMPGGEEGTLEALKCAACQCHRNFHRRDADGEPPSGSNYYHCYNPNSKANGSRSRILRAPPLPLPSPLSQPIQKHRKFPIGLPTDTLSGLTLPIMMNFGRGGGDGYAGTDSSTEELNVYHTNVTGTELLQPPHYRCSLSKKRFRTKFTKDQKHKMLEFAEKVGWRMPKQDQAVVKHFCDEVGVKRQVLKVWMHNNKHTMKKKDL